MFAGLTSWPYSFKYGDIMEMTPRQTFKLYDRLNEATKRAKGEETGETEFPSPAAEPSQYDCPGGMGLEQYDCWRKQPCPYCGGAKCERCHQTGQADINDPFAIPRELVKERTFTMLYELGRRGALRKEGIQPEPLQRQDTTQLRDVFAKLWAANEEKFAKLKAEREGQ